MHPPLILVVDDSREVRLLLADGLSKAGYRVEPAASAESGLAALRRRGADLAVLDLEMPGRSGAECLRAIRADPALARLPVLALAEAPSRETVRRVAALGVQGMVVKGPGLLDRLLPRIRAIVDVGAAPTSGTAARAPDPAEPESVSASATGRPPEAPPAASGAPGGPCGGDADGEAPPDPVINADEGGVPVETALEQLRALKPMISRSDLNGRMLGDAAELRAMGPVARQVLSLTAGDRASIEQVAATLKQDQALSLRMLRLASSSLYGRGDRVSTVQKAIARIGLAQVRSTVMSMGVIDQFGGVYTVGRASSTWFWEHSVACGLIAMRVTQALGGSPLAADAMFTAGLLHDIGRMLFAQRLGAVYADVVDTAERLELPLEAVETRLLLVNHADLTDRLLRRWAFAAELVNPIAMHHLSVGNIRRMAPRMIPEVCTLALANRLAHALLLGSSGNDVLYPVEEFVQQLGLGAAAIGNLCRAAPDEVADLRLNLLAHSPHAGDSFLDHVRGQVGPGVRPLVVAREPATDAVSICLGGVHGGRDTGAPNVAVARVTSPKERPVVLAALAEREQELGVASLPVLTVANSVHCIPTGEMLGGRRAEAVLIPARLSRIIRHLRRLAGVEAAA